MIRTFFKVSITMVVFLIFSAMEVYAIEDDAYVTPDSWSKHITANGVKSSLNGLSFGDGGTLKLGLTTRGRFRFSEDNDAGLYQYLRARLSGNKLGNGEVNINFNVRGGWNSNPRLNPREYYVYYDGMNVSRDNADIDFRIYQANIELKNVIPLTDIALGRIYLSSFDGYKIDGASVTVNPADFMKINLYYGLPVSYYSNLKNTKVAGASLDFPIEQSGTRIRAEYSYFMSDEGGIYNTMAAKGRIDQKAPYTNIYLEGAIVGAAMSYEAGIDGNIDKSRTGFSAYVMGQYDKNKHEINPYLSMYENFLGSESEYVMGGFRVTQGITDYLMLTAGFEGRYNMSESYGDRDYYRVFGTVDLVGLIHRNNFLSLIADWYTIAQYKRQEGNSKLFVGARMTQKFTDNIEAWVGVNVMNYQYKRNPIKYYQGETGFDRINTDNLNENTTLAYVGGMWQITDWCVVQLDYTFEYASLFKADNLQPNVQTVEAWVNFLW